MKTELMTKTLVTFVGAFIMLLSIKALAFIPPQSAVNDCIDAVQQKYAIVQRDLGLDMVRAQPIGDESAVIYLHTAAKPDTAQQRVRLYCTVNRDGVVTKLRANPRLLDVLK
ncbi:MAG: hypothetical protein ACR2P1_11140 [Pseudomonadales bacterium]